MGWLFGAIFVGFGIVLTISLARAPEAFCIFVMDQAGCRESLRKKPVYEKATWIEGIFYSSSRSWKVNRKLEWIEQDGKAIKAGKSMPPLLLSADVRDITILIHGFRGTDDTLSSYFSELAVFLQRRGPNHPVIIYDWPSVARPYETLSSFERDTHNKVLQKQQTFSPATPGYNPQKNGDDFLRNYILWEKTQYETDQANARTDGADGLAALIAELAGRSPTAGINVVAHSMGCFVVEQTLRKHPVVAAGLRNVLWLAPDVAARAFDNRTLREAVGRMTMLAIFYSRDDEALVWPSWLANVEGRLGAVGSRSKLALPPNVRIHDATASINEALRSMPSLKGQGVHGAFLRPDTRIADAIVKLLAGSEGPGK